MELSHTTQQVYDYIQHYRKLHNRMPTQRKIAIDCYMAHSTVHYHINKLRMVGLLRSGRKVVRFNHDPQYTDAQQLQAWRQEQG